MALSPNVVVVAPGELITATHLNNIRANLINIDTLANTATTDITGLKAADTSLDGRLDVIETDSGQTNIGLHSSFTGAFFFHKSYKTVWFVCNITATVAVNNTTVNLGILPAAARPPASFGLAAVTSVVPSVAHRAVIDGSTGQITINNLTVPLNGVTSMTACWVMNPS